jgi:hypothetical protein
MQVHLTPKSANVKTGPIPVSTTEKDTTYNGWSNYATWRINLEIFDGVSLDDFSGVVDKFTEEEDGEMAERTIICEPYVFASQLSNYAEEIIFQGVGYDERRPSNLMEDYARAFLQDVNYIEIAEHMIEDYTREQA